MSWRQSGSALRDEATTSRAVNVSVDEAEVRSQCAKHVLPISAIETLLSGGTRVVLVNGDAAAKLRKVFKSKLLTGKVERLAWAGHR